jgi:hypothetical protein
MFKMEGTNYVDYVVLAPEGREWRFKVEHRITRRFKLGPFKFEAAPQDIIYRSPVMTNSLGRAD